MIDQSNVAGGGNAWRPITIAAVRRASRNSIAGNGSEAAHHNAIWTSVATTPAAIPASIALHQWMLRISYFNGLWQSRRLTYYRPWSTCSARKRGSMSAFEADSVVTCPQCGFAKRETMPTDACQFYYECGGCKALLRPEPGDCCVFCSFG